MNSPIPDFLFTQATATQSLLGQLLLSELESFQIKTMQTIDKTSSSVDYYINSSTSGTLVPISPMMDSYVSMLKNRKTFSRCTYTHLFNNVTRKILTLDGKFSFQQALLEIDKFRIKAGKHFYGAVLRSGSDKLINPYHVLTPISFMKHPEIYSDQFSVLLYFYSNRTEAESDTSATFSRRDTDYITDLLNNIIKCSNHKAETHVPNNIESILINNTASSISNSIHSATYNSLFGLSINVLSADEITEDTFNNLNYEGQIHSSSSDTLLLAAHQIMVNGIFAPEYGVSLLKKTNSGLHGTFLTPSASCNIQSNSLNSSLTWASVCTGRESQRTFDGISSLHCSNYASAYNREAHSSGSMLLADLSIAKTVEIYQKIGLLPIPLPSTPSADEISIASDFMAYIEHMTTNFKLDLPQIEARYQLILGQTNEQAPQTPGSDNPEQPTGPSNSAS